MRQNEREGRKEVKKKKINIQVAIGRYVSYTSYVSAEKNLINKYDWYVGTTISKLFIIGY